MKNSPYNPRFIVSLYQAAGHLALWVGLYCTGAAVCFAQVSGISVSSAVFWAAGLTGMSVYLLDRVKLADTWLDPADRAAHPDRFGFLGSRTKFVRAFSLTLGLIAMVIAARIHPVAISFVPLAGLGVLLYAGLPRITLPTTNTGQVPRRSRRVKDLLFVKNIAVAACLTGFVGSLIVLDTATPGQPFMLIPIEQYDIIGLLSATVFVFGIVLADAIMCDIDDANADREHGTATVPGRFGAKCAWLLSGGLHLFVCALILLVTRNGASAHASQIWASLVLGSFLLVAVWRPKKLRDLIDLRLAVLAFVASTLL